MSCQPNAVNQMRVNILAENAGRVNFAKLDNNFVGLAADPIFSTARLEKWRITSLPLDEFQIDLVTADPNGDVKFPMFYQATLEIQNQPGKGLAHINPQFVESTIKFRFGKNDLVKILIFLTTWELIYI